MGLSPTLGTIQAVVTGACLLALIGLVVCLVRDTPPGRRLLNLMLGIELLLVIHLVVGLVRVFSTDRDVATWEYAGYLLGLVLIVPAGVVWSSSERSRGGTGVLLVATLVVPFMFLRLATIWAGGA